jgi:pimeloyl-ACP methyl ester carboxylesterase
MAMPAALSYAKDLQRAHERAATDSRIAQTAKGPIEYSVLGQGPAVLLAHGAGGGFDQMLEFAAELAAGGFRVVAMSRFGYLRTPLPPDASPAAQADAHAALLDALGIDRAAIIGISAGAPSSLQFALRYPARCDALVLLVPLAYSPPPTGQPAPALTPVARFVFEKTLKSDFLFWVLSRGAQRLLVKTVLATPPRLLHGASADERRRVRGIIEHILPVSERQQGMLNDASIGASLPRYELERIAARTLVISAADDLYGTYVSARYTAEHLPNARFIGYAAGGHVWVGHHREILSEIRTFLRPQ